MAFIYELSTKDINYLIKQTNIEFSKIKKWKETLQKEINQLGPKSISDLTEDKFDKF